MLNRELTADYIRGLIDGEGSFMFTTTSRGSKKVRIPTFQLKMHERDKDLIEGVRNFLGLHNRVYTYHHPGKDGANRKPYVLLIVRELGSLKNIIIPFFYTRLAGNKAFQFENWLTKIGKDPMVPESYKLLYRLHESGYYARNPKFLD